MWHDPKPLHDNADSTSILLSTLTSSTTLDQKDAIFRSVFKQPIASESLTTKLSTGAP